MIEASILVVTDQRPLKRDVARALRAAGSTLTFAEDASGFATALDGQRIDLVILDCDLGDQEGRLQVLDLLAKRASPIPLVLLSVGTDKAPLLELFERHEVNNLIAKHAPSARAIQATLDERELLVTCEKLLRRNIFGVEKYVGSWGVVMNRATITSVADKSRFIETFEQYLLSLSCPRGVIPDMLVAADELILNAVVHAPRSADGTQKYEHLGPRPDLALQPEEFVEVVYACDGQRLMLSVSDRFGGLSKPKLRSYVLHRFCDDDKVEPETKVSGAGLGLMMAFRSIHQLIVNVQETKRTEVIAGWHLRGISSGGDFRQVAKSMNIFCLPPEAAPV